MTAHDYLGRRAIAGLRPLLHGGRADARVVQHLGAAADCPTTGRRALWRRALREAEQGSAGAACRELVTWWDGRVRCRYCEGTFRPTRSDAETCSAACRQAVRAALTGDPADAIGRPTTYSQERYEATGYGAITPDQAREHDARIRAERAEALPVGERIEVARLRRRATVEAAAEAAGVSERTWYRWTGGHDVPSAAALDRLVEAWGLDRDALAVARHEAESRRAG